MTLPVVWWVVLLLAAVQVALKLRRAGTFTWTLATWLSIDRAPSSCCGKELTMSRPPSNSSSARPARVLPCSIHIWCACCTRTSLGHPIFW